MLICGPEFSRQEIHSSVVFNPVQQSSALAEDQDSEVKGAVVRRNWPVLMFDCIMSSAAVN